MNRLISITRRHWKVSAIVLCGALIFGVDSLAFADRGGNGNGGGGGGGKGGQAAQAPRGGGGGGGGARSAPRQSAPRQAAPRQSAPRSSAARPSSAPRPSARPSSAPRPQAAPTPNVNRPSGSAGGSRSRPTPQRGSNASDIQRQAAQAAAQKAARERQAIVAGRGNTRPSATERPGSNSNSKPRANDNRPDRSDVIPNVNGPRPNGGDRGNAPKPQGGRDRDVNDIRDPKTIPNVNRPSLNKPTRDAIDRGDDRGNGGKDRDVIQGLDGNGKGNSKPDRKNIDGRDGTLGGAKPGEALIKPVKGDPEVLQGFKPGRLNGKDDVRGGRGGGGMGSVDRGARDPEVVKGLRNRDVRDGDAIARERINRGEKFVNSSKSSCGHSFCGGHGGCNWNHGHHGHHDHDRWSFSFGFFGGGWGFGVGYNNWYAPSYCYDWPYYRPYYYRPYYYRPYYYGCYFPRYPIFSSYNYYPYARSSVYWWLYDDDDDYYSPNYYGEGYNDGFSTGYEAGMENADDVGGYQPTWLGGGAGGASTAGGSMFEDTPPAREIAPSNDGWDLLVAGDVREARRAFDRDTLNAPGDGLPQIGYAITAGLMERYDEAVAAMRKAVRDDPDSFRETPRDVRVGEQMRTLLTHYRNVTREKPDDIDGLFMTAALRHLMGEDALAYFSVSLAIESGDKDQSAVILKTLIQRSLDAQTEQVEPAATPTPPAPATVPSVIEPATSPTTGQPF